MPRILDTKMYENLVASRVRESNSRSVVTPGGLTQTVEEMIEATAGASDLPTQFRHELVKNHFNKGGAKSLLEISKMFGQSIEEFALDKLIFDLEIETIFSKTVVMDLNNYGAFPLGGGANNYGNAGGYPSTTGNPSGGGRSNGPRGF
jgi:hypothetical protein